MGFSQSEIKWDGNTLYLEHGFQKVSIPLDGTYNINGFEDKLQGGIYIKKEIDLNTPKRIKRTIVYVSEINIKSMFGIWLGQPYKPSILGSEEFVNQVNFYLDIMKVRLPYFYKFVCDTIYKIIENNDMDDAGARIKEGDIYGKCEMMLPTNNKFIYGWLLHEARHVYDYDYNPDMSNYDRELNAYKLTYMAMRDIGFDEEYMKYYTDCIETNVLEPLKK